MPREKFLTVEEAVEMVMNDMDSDDSDVEVVNIPPEGSDEDEGNDEETGVAGVSDVPGSVEVHFERSKKDNTAQTAPTKKRRMDKSAPVWRNAEPQYTGWQKPTETPTENREKIAADLGTSTAVEIFEKIFTPEVFHLIQVETLRYAKDIKNDPLFSLSDGELKAFLGILMYSGYCALPSERMYWSEDCDLKHPIVRDAMPRSKYLKIKSYLHLQDNAKMTPDNKDRGFKVRPLLDIINRSFQQYGVFQERLAVDEMIVRYYGHNSLKQFIRGKPIRFGYKLWAICGSDGYCHKFDLYCGKEQRAELCHQPLGTRVVLDMISVISDPSGHELFFDNLLTSRTLLADLKGRGIRATGTVRENRLDKCPVTTAKEMSKTKRGSYEQRFDRASEVLLVRWHDNKVVNVMTNYDTANPASSVTRYDRAAKKRVPVPQPKALKTYNAGMGGVDLHDQLLGAYEVSIRGKKWYWCLITRVLDMAVVNSHILHKTAVTGDKQLTLLNFRREIAVTYLRAAASERGCSARPLPGNTPVSLRYDGVGHFLAPLNGRRQCQLESCKLRSTKRCVKCDVAICLKCFVSYHQRK